MPQRDWIMFKSFVNKPLCLLFALLSASVLATPTVLTSIKPIGLIAKDIAKDHAKVDILLPDNASPHGFSLTPSDIRALNDRDLLIWVGPEIEPFLTKTIAGRKNQLQLTALPNIQLRRYGSEHVHSHGEHHHETSIDGHIWLGPEQSVVIADGIKTQLIALDPENKVNYERNFAAFKQKVASQQKAIYAQLKDYTDKNYFLFHDAYGYFEQAFDLKALGNITLTPDRKPGARTLVGIRQKLQAGKVKCIFSEPQFNPSLVETLVVGTNTKIVLLDPMAKNLSLNTHSYTDFLAELTQSFMTCFEPTKQ
jgi:zinc transport system substrate-binding protein